MSDGVELFHIFLKLIFDVVNHNVQYNLYTLKKEKKLFQQIKQKSSLQKKRNKQYHRDITAELNDTKAYHFLKKKVKTKNLKIINILEKFLFFSIL